MGASNVLRDGKVRKKMSLKVQFVWKILVRFLDSSVYVLCVYVYAWIGTPLCPWRYVDACKLKNGADDETSDNLWS